MASIKISNLPSLTATSVSNNDYFIVNDENQTTSKLQFTEFVEALSNQNYTFSGVVNFTGSVSVNVVDDTSSNIYTKASVNTLIAESEARDNVKILANTTDITQLQNLIPAPTSGGLFAAGTFTGAASTANQLVSALNLVANQSSTTSTEISAISSGLNDNTQAIANNTASVVTLTAAVDEAETDIEALEASVATAEQEIDALQAAVGDASSGLTEDLTTLTGRVAANEADLVVLKDDPTTATAVTAVETTAVAAQAFATANNVEYRDLLGLFATKLGAAVSASNPATPADLSAQIITAIGDALADLDHAAP